ncbi:MAG TPA: pyridoxal-dependent decarboxylase [Arachnia sp.]|nr:pyridoxal-dependent decarboxylase [Arachnia sp.]HMT86371.1 pyridoxal-dependent decarboxylase [Arachnia sp.]
MSNGAHMGLEEFKAYGHEVIDWIADYWATLQDRPVSSTVSPGDITDALPQSAPEEAEEFSAVLADLDTVILPGITHWQHPRFFGYFPSNTSPAAVLADLLSSGIGAQGMMWATSPALTELEITTTDWLGQAIGLPADFLHRGGTGGGVIQDTASTATIAATLAALHRVSHGRYRKEGQGDTRFRIYASAQAHSSVQKAALVTGLGELNVQLVPENKATQRLKVEHLASVLEADRLAGVRPAMIVAAVGSTSTGAVDDVRALGELAREYGAWLHIDAAWAGVAAICPEHRDLLDGVAEYADSIVINPHKWMLTTFDCSVLWTRDKASLVGSMTNLPEYLRNKATDSGAVVDFRDWHPQLGRRFRSLKLWTVLRTYGLEGIRQHVRSSIDRAIRFEELLAGDERFSLPVPRSLALVTFQLSDDDTTLAVMERLNESGVAFLTHTRVNGRAALRLATGALHTSDEDIARTYQALSEAAEAVQSS